MKNESDITSRKTMYIRKRQLNCKVVALWNDKGWIPSFLVNETIFFSQFILLLHPVILWKDTDTLILRHWFIYDTQMNVQIVYCNLYVQTRLARVVITLPRQYWYWLLTFQKDKNCFPLRYSTKTLQNETISSISSQWHLSISPENIRRILVFWCFPGV